MKRSVLLLLVVLLSGSLLNAAETIELSAITSFSPKGRVQDKSYNPQQPIIDALVAKGVESIPLLMEQLDNDTLIEHQVLDCWPQNTVGDVALVILTDLATSSDWKTSTIPGAGWAEMLDAKADMNTPAWKQLSGFKEKHGSSEIKRRWQKIWSEYRERIYWDAKDRCLKVKSGDPTSHNSH